MYYWGKQYKEKCSIQHERVLLRSLVVLIIFGIFACFHHIFDLSWDKRSFIEFVHGRNSSWTDKTNCSMTALVSYSKPQMMFTRNAITYYSSCNVYRIKDYRLFIAKRNAFVPSGISNRGLSCRSASSQHTSLTFRSAKAVQTCHTVQWDSFSRSLWNGLPEFLCEKLQLVRYQV